MGRRRGGGRHRLDRAVSLLRVQAPLPLRDHGRGARGRAREVRARSPRSTTTSWRRSWPCSTRRSTSPTTRSCATGCSSSEQVLVGVHRTSAREEEARQLARSRTRDLEFAWATFLTRGMEQGAIPEADPRLLTRAILGLYNSVFHWYRPGGDLALADVARLLRPPLPRRRGAAAARGRGAGAGGRGKANGSVAVRAGARSR